jgi:hypothetical protein
MTMTTEKMDKKPLTKDEDSGSMTLLIEDTQRQRLERRLRDRKLRRGLSTNEALKVVNTRKSRHFPKKG